MSIVYKCPQGSVEWLRLRIGIPTASQMHRIVTPGGKLSEQRWKYMDRLIYERLLNESADDPLHVEWVEHGKENEPYAAQQFEFLEGCELEPVGFITDNDGRFGCSPDRLIKRRNEIVEIKCPAGWTQIGRLLRGLDNEYKPQVQSQLLITECDRVHFYSYHPRMPAFHIVTKPDKAFQKIMRQHLSDFCEELEEMTARARDMGAYSPYPTLEAPHQRTAPGREPDAVNIIPD